MIQKHSEWFLEWLQSEDHIPALAWKASDCESTSCNSCLAQWQKTIFYIIFFFSLPWADWKHGRKCHFLTFDSDHPVMRARAEHTNPSLTFIVGLLFGKGDSMGGLLVEFTWFFCPVFFTMAENKCCVHLLLRTCKFNEDSLQVIGRRLFCLWGAVRCSQPFRACQPVLCGCSPTFCLAVLLTLL